MTLDSQQGWPASVPSSDSEERERAREVSPGTRGEGQTREATRNMRRPRERGEARAGSDDGWKYGDPEN